jgi:large subunit ribosomal protein L6
MSKIAKKPIAIPEKVDVTVGNFSFSVKGPLGTLERMYKPAAVGLVVNGREVSLKALSQSAESRALVGTYAAHLRNMLAGVVKPFEKKLIIEGIGFKADAKGDTLHLALGFSHPITIKIPAGLTIKTEKGAISISGANKELVGEFAARIRSLKKPEPYKGKGIHYDNEVIRRKQGKRAT